MTEPAEAREPDAGEGPGDDAAVDPAQRDRTRRMTLPPPPVAGSPPAAGSPPVPGSPPAVGSAPRPPRFADQPTDELPPPPARPRTDAFGAWQPLHPRVVPRYRSRWPWVVGTLVVLVLAAGIVVFVIYR